MSNHELGLWEAVLRLTTDASCDTTGPTRVVEHLMQSVEVDNPVVSDLSVAHCLDYCNNVLISSLPTTD
jgi:hypothetical protein